MTKNRELCNFKLTFLGSLLGLILSSSQAFSFSKHCRYDFLPKESTLQWTAFKTNEKLPVKGKFIQYKLNQASFPSLKDFLTDVKMDIDSAQIDTANPARDTTITHAFFLKMTSPTIKVSTQDIQGEKTGQLNMVLSLNGKSHKVPMEFTMEEDSLTLTGGFDFLKFDMIEPLKSLNEVCFDLHKGKDGISKTWSEVELLFVGKFKKQC